MSWKARLIQAAGLVFCPQECALCQAWVVNSQLTPLCRPCWESLIATREPVCHFCGIPVPGAITQLTGICSRCRRQPPPFDWARGWGVYEDDLRRLIHRFKFESQRRLCIPLSDLLVQTLQTHNPNFAPNWIIPIPCHKQRRRERGFDQSDLLARRLSKRLQVPRFDGLWRCRKTAPQPGLKEVERRRNLRHAFAVRHSSWLRQSRVLVIDDVMTSGTTVAEAARVLKAKGVVEVGVLVVARARKVW